MLTPKIGLDLQRVPAEVMALQAQVAGPVIRQVQAAPVALTTSTTLTAANLLVGLITGTQGGGAGATYTLPTGTLMDTAALALWPDLAVNDSFDFEVVNLGAASEVVTIAAGATFTLVGSGAIAVSGAAGTSSSARFRARRTAANTWVAYRIG